MPRKETCYRAITTNEGPHHDVDSLSPRGTPHLVLRPLFRLKNEADTSTPHEATSICATNHQKSLFDFPAEVRILIYDHLFDTARLSVEPHGFLSQEVKIYREPGSGIAILRTSKAVFAEAYPVLLRNTNNLLVAQSGCRCSNKAILDIPYNWRAAIEVIEYAVFYPKLHLRYADYPNLRQVYIGCRAYHVEEKNKPTRNEAGVAILRKIAKEDKCLVDHGSSWIRSVPHVSVVLKVLLMNHRAKKSVGWVAEVDTAHWMVLTLKAAELTNVPMEDMELQRVPPRSQMTARKKWKRGPNGWNIRIL